MNRLTPEIEMRTVYDLAREIKDARFSQGMIALDYATNANENMLAVHIHGEDDSPWETVAAETIDGRWAHATGILVNGKPVVDRWFPLEIRP